MLVTLDQLPTRSDGVPHHVTGFAMLNGCLYVVYYEYNKVQVFLCEDGCKKIKEIEVKEMESPWDMAGSDMTSQLFISERNNDIIWRVDLEKGIGDVFIKTGYMATSLSLAETRLLASRDSLLMFDILSGEGMKEIPFSKNIKKHFVEHVIETNRGTFFVCHGHQSGNRTVSEIDSEGRVIQVLDNKQRFDCYHLALDSFGRLIAAEWKNNQVVLFNEHLQYERVLVNKRSDNAVPTKLSYNKKNNRLMVCLDNKQVEIFKY